MIRVGITGMSGFIGTHLYNTIGLYPEKFIRVPFKDHYFQNKSKLEAFVKGCDVIIHLAAVNRHNEPDVIYNTNIILVEKLIAACESTGSIPHILFSSSIQEERDNKYGNSKKEGRRLFENWAIRNSAQFSGFIIPNVFGPFGNPYYNSVIATFCHQLTHNEQPILEVDGDLKLIYVAELVQKLLEQIEYVNQVKRNETFNDSIHVQHTTQSRVSNILEILESFKKSYFDHGQIPALDLPFHRNLFNTFLCYIDHKKFFPFKLNEHCDLRGSFVEAIKLQSGGQISFSSTVKGITRGNHFHTRKAERFVVTKGKALIQIRRVGTNKFLEFELSGDRPSFVDMPIWYTHNIKNIGTEELYTIFWISEFYNSEDADTFYDEVEKNSYPS